MKILYIINSLGRGGAEKVVATLAIQMAKRGHKVAILKLTGRDDEKVYIEELQQKGVKIISLGISNPRNPLNLKKLIKYLKYNHYEIIHTHLFPALYWSSFASLLNPKFRKQCIWLYTEHSNENKRRKYRLIKSLEKNIYGRFHKIIAITQEVKRNLSVWINNDKVVVIENGVDIEKIRLTTTICKVDLCKMLGVSQDSCFVLMSASFRYPKDQKTLIKACELLGDKYQVLLAGEGQLKTEIQEYSAHLGIAKQIHFLGFRNDVASLMKSADINVLSSEYEGMSGVTLEALASGKPFLGSDVPGINDIVPDNRFLFRKGDANELAAKIAQLINDNPTYDNMSATAFQYVLQFDISHMIDKHEILYQSLISKQVTNIDF